MRNAAAAAWVIVLGLSGCNLQTGRPTETAADAVPKPSSVSVDAPSSNPPERDDESAPLVGLEVHGKAPDQIVIPRLFGYPLYAQGPAIQGVRLLRQDNWMGYDRQEQTQPDNVVHVFETFPALGCTFEGIQDDQEHYVPLMLTCDLPVPKERGSGRAVAGAVQVGAKSSDVPKDPALAKAFFREWHATSEGFNGD